MKNPRIDWTALVESVAASMFLVMVAAIPLLLGRPIGQWALAGAFGLIVGLVVHVRVELRRRSGKDPSDDSGEELE